MLVGVTVAIMFQDLVGPLRLAVRLQVVARRQGGTYPKEMAGLLPKAQGELGPSVGHHLRGDAMEADDVLHKHLGERLGIWQVGKGNEVDHLREEVHRGANYRHLARSQLTVWRK